MLFRVENLRKNYDDNIVLDDVSLDMRGGDVHGIIGYNGSGKSTFAKILTGILQKDGGKLILNNKIIDKWNIQKAMQAGVFYVGAQVSLLAELTVSENMTYGLNAMQEGSTFRILKNQRTLDKNLEIEIKKYGLECKKTDYVSELPYSLKNVLEIIRVKILQPKFIVIDEVDSNVNHFYKNVIEEIIKELKEMGVGIIYISHQINRVIKLADRVSILMDTKLLETVEKNEIKQESMVEKLFYTAPEKPPKTVGKPKGELLELKKISNSKIQDFSMRLRKGEILGIVGLEKEGPGSIEEIFFHKYYNPNGKGESYVKEKKVIIKTPQNAIGEGIVLLNSNEMEKYLFTGKPVYENMLPFSVKIKYKDKEKQKEICRSYLKKLSIKVDCEEKIEHISTGYQKKILIARNVLSEGEVYIFNNPTDNIDIISKIDIYNIMNELKRKENGVIIVSNDYHEVAGISDVVVIVQDGKIIKKYHNYTMNEREIFGASLDELNNLY